VTGRILSMIRASLTKDHVNESSRLNKWIHANLNESRQNNTAASAKRAEIAGKIYHIVIIT
jgi:hypothetical protein